MAQARTYKKMKKTTVQLTSLLDLLFVMIFVSLIQNKTLDVKVQTKTKEPKPQTSPVVKTKVKKKKIVPEPQKLITYGVRAEFKFYPTPGNPNLPKGSYVMQGTFNEKNRKLNLGGVSWLNRPAGYDMVPLAGEIEKTHTLFKGKVDFPGCKEFTLRRVKTTANSPISGVWEGVYDCSQGPTGLTLTID